MSYIYIKTEKLCKSFSVLRSEKTMLRMLKLLIKGKSLKNNFWALKDVSFSVNKGEKIAVVGKNGSGKTTLLRILTGIYDNTSGCVYVKGLPFALFDLTTGLNQELSVIDNIYLFGAMYGIPRATIRLKIHTILEMADLSHLKLLPFKELSSGQCRRAALSVFFHIDNKEFMVIDEGLLSIDPAFVYKCERYLEDLFSPQNTIIMSSHDAVFLKRYCKRAIWLENGRIRMDGEAKEVIEAYENYCRV